MGSNGPPCSATDNGPATTSAGWARSPVSNLGWIRAEEFSFSLQIQLMPKVWGQKSLTSHPSYPWLPLLALGLVNPQLVSHLKRSHHDRFATPHATELSAENWAPGLGRSLPSVDPVRMLRMHTSQRKPWSIHLKSFQKPKWERLPIAWGSDQDPLKPSRPYRTGCAGISASWKKRKINEIKCECLHKMRMGS